MHGRQIEFENIVTAMVALIAVMVAPLVSSWFLVVIFFITVSLQDETLSVCTDAR